MTIFIRVAAAALAVAGASAAAPAAAQGLSAGCSALNAIGTATINAGNNFVTVIATNVAFEAGEAITITSQPANTGLPGGSTVEFGTFITPGVAADETSAVIDQVNEQSITLILTTSGDFLIDIILSNAVGGPDSLVYSLRCAALSSQREAQARALATAAIAQPVGLVFGRMRAEARDVRADAPRAATALGGPALSAGRGAAGQGAGDPIGVWADFTWTGLENNDALIDSNTDAFAIAGGVDMEARSGIVFGAAISAGRAFAEAGNDALKATESSVGVTPYFAYQIDDRFSLQGLIGYGYASGSSNREGVTGDYDAHRYYAALEGALFETWGDASLYAGVGVLYGRSHRTRFTESDGTQVGSQRIDVGTASVILQPSYLVTVDDDESVFLEPFATFEYGYDFDVTKITDTANDRDAFRIGAGAYLYAGDAISGTLEATRMLGREDQDETTARATVRVDF